MMYFSRLQPRSSRACAAMAAGPGRLHHLLWHCFPTDAAATRDFLFRREPQGVYLLSKRRPDKHLDGWHMAAEPFGPRLGAGDRFRFAVRVNPVYSNRTGKHDVVMHARRGAPDTDREALAQTEVSAWFTARAARSGFQPDPASLRAENYQVHRFQAGPGRPGRISLATADVSGILTVTDTSRFAEVVAQGLGRGKGYGCGLMLLQRLRGAHDRG